MDSVIKVFKKFTGPAKNLTDIMHMKLTEVYDEKMRMIELKEEAKAAKKAKKELLLKMKADQKIIAMLNSKSGNYTKNCGIVI